MNAKGSIMLNNKTTFENEAERKLWFTEGKAIIMTSYKPCKPDTYF